MDYRNRFLGFLSRFRDIPEYAKNISEIGIDFSIVGKDKGKGVTREEEEFGIGEITGVDIYVDETTPHFDKDYKQRIADLHVFASNPEIEFILEHICDDSIVYDKFNKYCGLSVGILNYTEEQREKIEKQMKINFEKALDLFGYTDGTTAWTKFLEFLIEGDKRYEFAYDDDENPTRIVAVNELTPDSLIPYIKIEKIPIEKAEEHVNENKLQWLTEDLIPRGREKEKDYIERPVKYWKQVARRQGYEQDVIFHDNQIASISYNNIPGTHGRISYANRLMRDFNMMRIMEDTKVAWNFMNSQFRMKLIVPVGSLTKARAKQIISEVTGKYKEDLFIDPESGQINVHGQAKLNYSKTFVLPKRQNETFDIDSIAYKGPDLNNMDGVKHFDKKLFRNSKMPYSRYDRERGSGNRILFKADGIPFDELNYYKFINRLRKEFERPIKKFIYLQTIMDIPELKLDHDLMSQIGIYYESNSLFEDAKSQEIRNIKLDNISKMERLTDTDGRTPLFSKELLYVDMFEFMTKDEWDENKKRRNEELKSLRDLTSESR